MRRNRSQRAQESILDLGKCMLQNKLTFATREAYRVFVVRSEGLLGRPALCFRTILGDQPNVGLFIWCRRRVTPSAKITLGDDVLSLMFHGSYSASLQQTSDGPGTLPKAWRAQVLSARFAFRGIITLPMLCGGLFPGVLGQRAPGKPRAETPGPSSGRHRCLVRRLVRRTHPGWYTIEP